MKALHTRPIPFKYSIFTFIFSLPFFLLFLFYWISVHDSNLIHRFSIGYDIGKDLKIRPGYDSYNAYIQRQLRKTLNPELRKIWTSRDWDRKIRVFSGFFSDLKREGLLRKESRALCVGARVGQEVEALRRIGVADSVGIDLVPYPPLVVRGDFHSQPFGNDSFDFEFSNVFDHALYPARFVAEIERTLKPGGVCALHVALSRRSDRYSANDLYSVKPLVKMFRRSEVVRVRNIDGFGLDTEVIFRKKKDPS